MSGSSSKKTIFVTIPGITPLAIENSLLLFFKNNSNRFLHHLVLFSSQKGYDAVCSVHSTITSWLERISQEADTMGLKNVPRKIPHHFYEIDEYELESIIKEVFEKTSAIISNFSKTPDTEVVIDVTGGRKAMSIGAFLAALQIEQAFQEIPVFTSYYWLKHAEGRPLQKPARNLFRDEYEIRLWSPWKIIQANK